jgi:hypothetical protein
MWPFRSKTPGRASCPIDIYRLDAPIAGLSGLVEFSANQYAAMGGRVFEGERNYNGLAVALFLTSKSIQRFKKSFDDAPMPEREESSGDASKRVGTLPTREISGNEDKPAIEVTEPTFGDLYDQKPNG